MVEVMPSLKWSIHKKHPQTYPVRIENSAQAVRMLVVNEGPDPMTVRKDSNPAVDRVLTAGEAVTVWGYNLELRFENQPNSEFSRGTVEIF